MLKNTPVLVVYGATGYVSANDASGIQYIAWLS